MCYNKFNLLLSRQSDKDVVWERHIVTQLRKVELTVFHSTLRTSGNLVFWGLSIGFVIGLQCYSDIIYEKKLRNLD